MTVRSRYADTMSTRMTRSTFKPKYPRSLSDAACRHETDSRRITTLPPVSPEKLQGLHVTQRAFQLASPSPLTCLPCANACVTRVSLLAVIK